MEYGQKVEGSKNLAKQSWTHGRQSSSFRKEMKLSKRKNKKYLNRKVRHSKLGNTLTAGGGKAMYRRLAGYAAYEYLS